MCARNIAVGIPKKPMDADIFGDSDNRRSKKEEPTLIDLNADRGARRI